jgi:hypothetical protein
LEFAKRHKDWTVEDWRSVIGTDESTFEVGKSYGSVHVRQTAKEKYQSDCLVASHKSGRSSVMIWGGFYAGTKLDLVVLSSGRMNAESYINQVCKPVIGPFFENSPEARGLILMEDNAPIHTAKLTSSWRDERDIVKLIWPPQSPDLNPIENLWSDLKHTVSATDPIPTLKNMSTIISNAWKAIPSEKLEHLVSSMPDRIKAVLEAKGKSTRW